MGGPSIILLFSGKRKSGKDYICGKVNSLLGPEKCSVLRISEPLKSIFAKDHNLDLDELLGDGPYKEIHRYNMIKWGEEVREKVPGFFCKAACDSAPRTPVWIVSDIRRKTDLQWYKECYGNLVKTVRVSADIEVRTNRGLVVTKDVDDAPSECDLDNIKDWDLQISNNTTKDGENAIKDILNIIQHYSQ